MDSRNHSWSVTEYLLSSTRLVFSLMSLPAYSYWSIRNLWSAAVISSISRPESPNLCPAKNDPSGQANATHEMVGCDCNCERNTNSRFLASRVSSTCSTRSVRTAVSDDLASVVIDCSSSPTAETIWSLMVSASVWLTCCAVRHHKRCTPTALTMIDVRTRAEMALRMPMRISPDFQVLAGRCTALRNITVFVSLARLIQPLGHGSVTAVKLAPDETSGLLVSYQPRPRYV